MRSRRQAKADLFRAAQVTTLPARNNRRSGTVGLLYNTFLMLFFGNISGRFCTCCTCGICIIFISIP